MADQTLEEEILTALRRLNRNIRRKALQAEHAEKLDGGEEEAPRKSLQRKLAWLEKYLIQSPGATDPPAAHRAAYAFTAEAGTYAAALAGRLRTGNYHFPAFEFRLLPKTQGCKIRVKGQTVKKAIRSVLMRNLGGTPGGRDYSGIFRLISAQRMPNALVLRWLYNALSELAKGLHPESYAYPIERPDDDFDFPVMRAVDALRRKMDHEKADSVLKLDIRRYFDTVPHDKVMRLVENRMILKGYSEERRRIILLALGNYFDAVVRGIRRYLSPEDEKTIDIRRGLLQGSAVAVLLSNLYLDAFDNFLDKMAGEKRGVLGFVRYADDVAVILDGMGTVRVGDIKKKCGDFLQEELGLQLNRGKSRYYPVCQGLSYLGIEIWRQSGRTQMSIPDKKLSRLRHRINKIFFDCLRADRFMLNKAVCDLNRLIGYIPAKPPEDADRNDLGKYYRGKLLFGRTTVTYFARFNDPDSHFFRALMRLDNYINDLMRKYCRNYGEPLTPEQYEDAEGRKAVRRFLRMRGLRSFAEGMLCSRARL